MNAFLIALTVASSLVAQTQPAPRSEPVPLALAVTRESEVNRASNLLTVAMGRQQRADRVVAYVEQASSEIETKTKDVSNMWFRTWRTGGVADRYLATATKLEEMAKYALYENLGETAKVLKDIATGYRDVAEYVSLGGKDTVADGTGKYTDLIVSVINRNSGQLNRARQEAASHLATISEEVDQLKAKLDRLSASR